MVYELLFNPLLSILTILLGFLLMIWPGYALLHLLGHGRHRWSGALFAGPGLTLALWIIALSGATWARVPLSSIFALVWIATMLLAILGVCLRLSVNRQTVTSNREGGRWPRLLWLIAVALPLLIMPATLRFGLGDFVNSTYPDPWSYVMVADYLAAFARGAEGGLSSLHQYAAHLMNTRNASPAILAQLAAGFGGIKADQVMTPFCLLVLFANTCALIAFARTILGRAELAACLALLAGLGWPANIVFAGNFDQLLLLPLLPLIAALALRTAGPKLWSASILTGILAAAALYAYVELAFLGILVALSFAVPPGSGLRVGIRRALLVCGITACMIVVLAWPGLDALLHMLGDQYAMAVGVARPGEGNFAGLSSPLRLPGAISALGGEFQGMFWWSSLPWLIGAALCAATLMGAWQERRRWTVLVAFAIVALAFVEIAYRQHYSYGAYKIVSVNIWMLGFLTIAGVAGLAASSQLWLPTSINLPSVITALLLSTTLDRTIVQARIIEYGHNALRQEHYREALAISAVVGDAPTLLSIRDDVANEWAVYYLSEPPLLIVPYRRYMAQSHVIPFMERARAVKPSEIEFVVTDRNDAMRAPLSGAKRIWDGQSYSLWKIDSDDWAVIADVRNPIDPDPSGQLGVLKTEFMTVTARGGPANFTLMVQSGPRDLPEPNQFHGILEDGSGRHQILLQPGENRLQLFLAQGRGTFAITLDEPPSGKPPVHGGTAKPSFLHVIDCGIEREG